MQKGWEEKYYIDQAGSGFAPYAGLRYQKGNGFRPYSRLRYQRGNGFLGRIWKGVTLPLLKYIGRHGIEAAGNVVREVSRNPDDVKEIIKKEALRVAGKAAEDGGKRLSTYIQTGKGMTRIPPQTNKAARRPRKNNKTNKLAQKCTSKTLNKPKTANRKTKTKVASFLSEND